MAFFSSPDSRFDRKRLFILAVLVLALIILLVLVWWWLRPNQNNIPGNTQPTAQEKVVLKTTVEQPAVPLQEPEQVSSGERELMNLARNFSERYASWSTDANFQNLEDLYPRVTNRLRAEFEQTKAAAQPSDGYRGMEARALKIDIDSLAAGSAQVTVGLQQVETTEQLEIKAAIRTLKLTLVKEGEFWLVDTVAWQ